MEKIIDLKILFRIVAVMELFYAAAAFLIPPRFVPATTGWLLSADGHWIVKLLGCALGAQAYLAWVLRDNPLVPVAKAFAFYQIASASADWLCWIFLNDLGVFSTNAARAGVVAAITTHYLLGFLLVLGIRKSTRVVR